MFITPRELGSGQSPALLPGSLDGQVREARNARYVIRSTQYAIRRKLYTQNKTQYMIRIYIYILASLEYTIRNHLGIFLHDRISNLQCSQFVMEHPQPWSTSRHVQIILVTITFAILHRINRERRRGIC
jgi:hypothetical protein